MRTFLFTGLPRIATLARNDRDSSTLVIANEVKQSSEMVLRIAHHFISNQKLYRQFYMTVLQSTCSVWRRLHHSPAHLTHRAGLVR